MDTSTICAISTPMGSGGIGIVRLSGPSAISIAEMLFVSGNGKSLSSMTGYTGTLGRVFDHKGEVDEVIAFVYRSPYSYTGEDVVEISCHGGQWILQRVLQLCIDNGAVAAAPGEFTKRAFLNGKMDLSEAEAVMDLIGACGDEAMRAALAAKDGALSRVISAIKEELVGLSSHLAAWADYPEEDIVPVDSGEYCAALEAMVGRIQSLLATWRTGRILRDGIDVAIVGKPNVGKSTLMNMLAGRQRSIVTSVPGTTRDIVEDRIVLGDIIVNLADTAGIHETGDLVEKIGVEKAKDRMESSALVLATFDISRPLEQEDLDLAQLLKGRPAVAVVNKSDLPQKLNCKKLEEYFQTVLPLSAQSGEGQQELESAIRQVVGMENLDPSAPMVATERQRASLECTKGLLQDSLVALGSGVTWDAVNVVIDEALASLLSISGERVSDAVVDAVFARFCVGK